jgi:hypothetical protein
MSSGFDALGKPIPSKRLQAGYEAIKEMIPGISTENAMTLVGKVANALEHDQPYEALRLATKAPLPIEGDPEFGPDVTRPSESDYPPVLLDVTGGYRLLAHLLAGER